MNADLNAIANAPERLILTQQKGPWDYVSTIAVVLTLAVLIWYTIETSRLRRAAQDQTRETGRLLQEAHQQNEATSKLVSEACRQNEVTASLWMEAQRQNEFSVMPQLAIILDTPPVITNSQQVYGGAESRLVLRNVGNGPAFNVLIEPYCADSKALELKNDRTVLTPGEERTLGIHYQYEPHHNDAGDPDSLYQWIETGKLPDPFQVTVRCRSVTSIDYRFTYSLIPKAGRLAVIYQGVLTQPGPSSPPFS
jgi:hypothetical protein